MQLATQRMTFREDVPILVLAWLVPSTLLLLISVQPAWIGGLLPTIGLPEISSLQNEFSISVSVQTVIGYVWPLILLFTFIVGIACHSLQVVGKRGMLIALTYCAVSLTVLTHFAPGNITLTAFKLVLLISLLGFCLYSRHAPKLAIGAGLCAASLLAMGPEMALFVAAATIWIAVEWALNHDELDESFSEKSLYFGLSFAFGTIFLGLSASSGWGSTSSHCGPLSLAYLTPTTLVGVGLAYLCNSKFETSGAKHKLYCLGFLAIGASCSLVAVNPNCLISPFVGSINEPIWAWKHGLLALFAKEPQTAYTIVATPLIGLCAACYAAATAQKQRSNWVLLLGCLIAATILMALDTNFAIFANALAIVPCAFLTLLVGRFSQTTPATPLTGAVFVAVWLSGMNLFHNFVGTHVIPDNLAHKSEATSGLPGQTTNLAASATAP